MKQRNKLKIHHIYLLFIFIFFACSSPKRKNLVFQEELGRYLFFDTRISINNTKSCASCHNPEFAFTDGYRTSISALGENLLHNSPSLINVVHLKKLDWSNNAINNLSEQIKRPLYNKHPVELGLDQKTIIARFDGDSLYNILFKKAYPNDTSWFTVSQIENAIVAFENTIVSTQSNFDKNILSTNQKNGLRLFTNNQLNCSKCHAPPFFTKATELAEKDSIYANIGLYNIENKNEYPALDPGLSGVTKNKNDNGKFKIPSLRNVLLTAPYMHDGSVESISEVIDIYARGGRLNKDGDGKKNKNKDKRVNGFTITPKEKQDLIEFLGALTDSSLFYNKKYFNPFKY